MERCTSDGHLVGMLDRDQRTARSCVFDRHVVVARAERTLAVSQRRRPVPGRTSPRAPCRSRINSRLWSSLQRLKHALIVGVYLSLVTFPSILTAPTIPMASTDALPDWLSPSCSVNDAADAAHEGANNTVILTHIIHQAKIAKDKADIFVKEEFVKIFKTDFEGARNMFTDEEFDWLPKLPNKLGEEVPEDHLKSLQYHQTLKDVYTFLQQVGLGIEQSIQDERNNDGPFVSKFNETKDNLRLVLCELHMAMIENGLTPPNSITKAIMKDQQGLDNTTVINVRNLIVYRKYLNLLDYTLKVFEYFKSTMA